MFQQLVERNQGITRPFFFVVASLHNPLSLSLSLSLSRLCTNSLSLSLSIIIRLCHPQFPENWSFSSSNSTQLNPGSTQDYSSSGTTNKIKTTFPISLMITLFVCFVAVRTAVTMCKYLKRKENFHSFLPSFFPSFLSLGYY